MPFEPAPKESPAARLAALIEAGRAANPDLKHGRGCFFNGVRACALGFAALAAGASRADLHVDGGYSQFSFNRVIEPIFGAGYSVHNIFGDVSTANDNHASLDEICLSLREGELAKVTA